MSALLTDAEHEVIERAGDLWNSICAAIPEGPTREADLGELVVHIHAIQHAFMANAAARAHPDTYRTLGGSLRQGVDDHPNRGPHVECLVDHGGVGVPRHCRRGCSWPCSDAGDA